jgi:hypothetical protein
MGRSTIDKGVGKGFLGSGRILDGSGKFFLGHCFTVSDYQLNFERFSDRCSNTLFSVCQILVFRILRP